MSSKYTLNIAGETTDFTKSTKATVVAEAERVRATTGQGVQVVTQAGTVVFELKGKRTQKYTRPGTKTIVLPAELQALVPEGYATAYERSRNQTVVLRRESDITDDDSRYAVMRRTTGEILGYAPTTRAAGKIQKDQNVRKLANA